MISPVSVLLALSMAANGAAEDTLAEMQRLLGGELTLAELNQAIFTLARLLTGNESLQVANSVWFDQGRVEVLEEFLHANARYFSANVYEADFDNKATIEAINAWVFEKTLGMVDEIIEEISPETIMYLINAIAFEADWYTPFNEVLDSVFTTHDGTVQTVDMMWASNTARFVSNHRASGFVKPYACENFSFAAFLPNENVDVLDFANSLTGQEFMGLMDSAEETSLRLGMPAFSFEYELSMVDALTSLGMPTVFCVNGANFSNLGQARDNIYIADVIHKTFIEVDTHGTRAAAVTVVEFWPASMPHYENTVILNRPFVFAITCNITNLPVFIGVVMEV